MRKYLFSVLALVFATSVSAGTFTFSPSAQTVTVGDNFNVAISHNNGSASWDYVFANLLHDDADISFVSVADGANTPTGLGPYGFANGYGSYVDTSGSTSTNWQGEWVVVTFKAKSEGVHYVDFNTGVNGGYCGDGSTTWAFHCGTGGSCNTMGAPNRLKVTVLGLEKGRRPAVVATSATWSQVKALMR